MTEGQPRNTSRDSQNDLPEDKINPLQSKFKPSLEYCHDCEHLLEEKRKEPLCRAIKGKAQEIQSLDKCLLMAREFESDLIEPSSNVDFFHWQYFFEYLSDMDEQRKIKEVAENLSRNKDDISIACELDVADLSRREPYLMQFLIENPDMVIAAFRSAYESHFKKNQNLYYKNYLVIDVIVNLPADLVPITPLSQLYRKKYKMVLIRGLISSIDESSFIPIENIWECSLCGNQMELPADLVKGGGFYGAPIPPRECSNPSCKNTRDFRLVVEDMRHEGRQIAHLHGFQENNLPETKGCVLVLFTPIIDQIHAGDTVDVSGLVVLKHDIEVITKKSKIICYIRATGVRIIKRFQGTRVLEEPNKKEVLIESVIDHLEQKGCFIIDEKYMWGDQDHIYYMLGFWLIPITSPPFRSLILPHVLDKMRNLSAFYNHIVYRREKYAKEQIFKRSYYNKDTNELLVSNHGTRYYRITESTMDVLQNGENGVYFLTDIQNQDEINVDRLIENGQQVSDLREYYQLWEFDDSLLSKEEWCDVLYAIDLCLACSSVIPSKPLFSVIGGWGTYKTTLFRNKLRFHKNKKANVFRLNPKDIDSLDVVLAEDDFVVLDNIESMPKEWLDSVAANMTGCENVKREKYTTSTAQHNKNESWIFTTSMNKPFNRADNESRVFYIMLTKVENTKFKTDASVDLFHDTEKSNQYFYQYLVDLQKMLHLIKNQPEESTFRMASFFRVFRAALMALDYSEERADETMQKFNEMQQSSTKEGNELLTLLIDLVNGDKLIPDGINNEGNPKYKIFNTGNDGVSPKDFLNLLKEAGYSENPNVRTLGNKLTEIQNNLLRENIVFERHEPKTHARRINYRIYNKDLPPIPNRPVQKILDFRQKRENE